jgi:ketosteroid isomerase-like protein
MTQKSEQTTDTVDEFVREWMAAWNSHDLDRIMTHYSENIDFSSPLIIQRKIVTTEAGKIRDLKTLREYFAIGLKNLPDLKFQLLEILRGVNGFTMYYINARGGHTAEYTELDEHGKATKVINCYSVVHSL